MLHIAVRQEGRVTILDLSGQLGFGFESQTLTKRVRELMLANQPFLLLNMARLDLIDSCGVAELVSSLSMIKQNGGKLLLCRVQKQVLEVLRITRMSTILQICETEEAAVASLAAIC